MIVVGIDQSLAQPGFAAVERCAGGWRVRELVSFATEADSAEKNQAIDDARRLREVASGLDSFLVRHLRSRERVVVVELLSGRARSHRADRSMSLVYGAVVATLLLHGVQPQFVSALTAKKLATGSATAEKSEVVAAMEKRWSWTPDASAKGDLVRVRAENEAKADALALATVIVARIEAEKWAAFERSAHA